MTNEPAAPPNPTRERIKYALAAVLAIVLGVVVFQTLKKETLAPPPPPKRPGARADGGDSLTQINGRTIWPRIDLDDVIAFDPFLPRGISTAAPTVLAESEPEASPEPDAAPVAKPPARLQAIYRCGDRSAALIESRHVMPGETLNGRRVLEINASSVLLEEPDGPAQK